jgi:hypothetical protein
MTHIHHAIQEEERLFYSEPGDWMIPARQYLGAYYLKMGDPVAAEKTYRADLIWKPGNGWSLLGLCQSLKVQHKTEKAVYEKNIFSLFRMRIIAWLFVLR